MTGSQKCGGQSPREKKPSSSLCPTSPPPSSWADHPCATGEARCIHESSVYACPDHGIASPFHHNNGTKCFEDDCGQFPDPPVPLGELERLRQAERMLLTIPLQDIASELGLSMGDRIGTQILGAIKRLKVRLEEPRG